MLETRDHRILALIGGLIDHCADEPGIAVSVCCGPEVVARRCVGLASVAHRVPIASHTRFHIVSVSKTFMAAAMVMLAARGALALDDDVRRYLPELRATVSPDGALIIRHLLSMTSGLRDVLEIERLRGVWDSSPSRTVDLLDLTWRQTCVRGAELIVEYGLGCDKGLAFAMEPIAPDVFLVRPTAPGITYRHVFRFDRDAAGRVTSAVVTMERLKRLGLTRVSPACAPTVG